MTIEHGAARASEPCRCRRVAVIVPTLNEVDNIDLLLTAVLDQSGPMADLEVLVADGGSTDGTVDRVRAWESRAPVRLVAGDGRRGLAGDVLAAARIATAEVVVVMDADFSHPPESIVDLVRPVVEGRYDMAVGSRYVPGGITPGWPASRRFLSRCAGAMAWPLSDLKDPMSGFFAVRRDRILAVDPAAAGFKIALEVLAAAGDQLHEVEVPITFRDRVRGQSKIGLQQAAAFCQRLMVLAGGAVSLGNAQRFAVVGLLGLGVDYLAFRMLFGHGFDLAAAHIASFALATVSNYALNLRWTFAGTAGSQDGFLPRFLRYLAVCLMALFLRGGVLSVATDSWGLPAETAILLGIASGAVVNYIGSAFYVFPPTTFVPQNLRWRVAAIGIVLYMLALRLAGLGSVNLIPAESYYWNYAQHLDIGYLDHPPVVAWLIWLGTSLFGNTEFAVRLGAYLCWIVAAAFSFQLARNLYGKTAAFIAVLLFSCLPFFSAIGVIMSPDAPLTAAWAGALLFLERALLGERRAAWWFVGICVGLGLLSKYTIALLGPATLLFLSRDRRSRAWFRQPGPYIAILVAAVLFSPVLAWNAQHEWASFLFQGPRRVQAATHFSLAGLFEYVLLLLTPVGIIAAFGALTRRAEPTSRRLRLPGKRPHLFVAIFTLVPLSVFFVFSLFHQTQPNWTGPLWLAVLPKIAADLSASRQGVVARMDVLQRAWRPTIATLLIAYGAGLHYLTLGLPVIGHGHRLGNLSAGWTEFGRQAALIEDEIETATGKKPLLVGMDTYALSSQLAFYDGDHDGAATTAGRCLVGRSCVMYDYWFPAQQQQGRNVVFFARKPVLLSKGDIEAHFGTMGAVREQALYKGSQKVGRFYYRVGYNYRAS